jgi:hypothetical protein
MVDVFVSMMEDVVPITVALLLLSASFYALTYMISKILNNDKLRQWTETEIHQTFATAVILFFAASFFGLFINMSDVFMMNLIEIQGLTDLYESMITPSADFNEENLDDFYKSGGVVTQEVLDNEKGQAMLNADSHMKYSYVFLLRQLNQLNDFYNSVFWANFLIGNPTEYFFPEGGKYGSVSTSGSTLRDSVMGYLFYGFFFTYVQLAMLDLIKVFFFFVFPAGVFLRAFPMTNAVGSSMIAIAVGIYFIYPLVLGILLISNHQEMNLDEHELIYMVKNEEPSEFLEHQIKAYANFEEVNPEGSGITGQIKGVWNSIANTMDLVLNFTQRILLNMFLFPLVAFTATYTFIHAFAGFMQSNVSELGRGLIRLI